MKLRELDVAFTTVELTTPTGTVLRVESDGRAGNGCTHWRAVYRGEELVAALTGGLTTSWDAFATVTIANHGELRQGKHYDFRSFRQAVQFLVNAF